MSGLSEAAKNSREIETEPTGKNYFYSRDVASNLTVISMTGVSSDSAGNPINGDLGTVTQI